MGGIVLVLFFNIINIMINVKEVRFVADDSDERRPGGFNLQLLSGSNCKNLKVIQDVHVVTVEFDAMSGSYHSRLFVPWHFIRYIRES